MKTIVSDAGSLGPFQSIEVLDDRLRADGVDYPFTVLGGYSITDGAPTPAPAPVPVPPSQVAMLNLRLAMHTKGWLQPWIQYLAALTGDAAAIAGIWWDCSNTVGRSDQWVADMTHGLNKTEAEADQLFILAASLNP